MKRRAELKRRTPLRPKGKPPIDGEQRPSGRRVPSRIKEEAKARTWGVCAHCLYRAVTDGGMEPSRQAARRLLRNGVVRSAAQVHHVLERRNFPQWVATSQNLVGVCAECHDEHERARRRIPWAALPQECRAWLREVAAVDPMAERALRNYPR